MVTGQDSLSWTKPYGNRTLGVGGDFLGFWPGGNPRPRPREKPQEGGVERVGEGCTGKSSSPDFPGGGLQLFLGKTGCILASSAMQLPASPVFSRLGSGIVLIRAEFAV